MSAELLFTIAPEHVGKSHVKIDGRVVSLADVIGRPLPGDVGKRVYDVNGVVQVENNEQRDLRLAVDPDGDVLREVTVTQQELRATVETATAARDAAMRAAREAGISMNRIAAAAGMSQPAVLKILRKGES